MGRNWFSENPIQSGSFIVLVIGIPLFFLALSRLSARRRRMHPIRIETVPSVGPTPRMWEVTLPSPKAAGKHAMDDAWAGVQVSSTRDLLLRNLTCAFSPLPHGLMKPTPHLLCDIPWRFTRSSPCHPPLSPTRMRYRLLSWAVLAPQQSVLACPLHNDSDACDSAIICAFLSLIYLRLRN
jgi:hypothetical protein